jgi:hypothetical protein
VPSPEYYHRQADLCLRMALLTSDYEERLRLLDVANGYRDDAVRVEAVQGCESRTLTKGYLPISIYEYTP